MLWHVEEKRSASLLAVTGLSQPVSVSPTSLLSCTELIYVINDVALLFLLTSASVLREMTEIASQKGST